MLRPSIADLEAAVATGSLERWLEAVPDAARPELRRALDVDRPLWTEHRDSLASCLLARTLGNARLDDLHAGWTRELDERPRPWIAALRPLPVGNRGLLAELHSSDDRRLDARWMMSFEAEDVICLRPDDRRSPIAPRGARLRWSWTRGEITSIPDLDAADPASGGYPRIKNTGRGPALLIASPGADEVSLPCPVGRDAIARIMADGARVLVYGGYDEDFDEDGFAYVVDLSTLAIERSFWMPRLVNEVHECARSDRLLVSTSGGLVVWSGDRQDELRMRCRQACLSPNGATLATLDDALRVWSVDALVENARRDPLRGFPAVFDPDGDRLLSGTWLFDGRSGRRLAEILPDLGHYLEGGPATPWLHVGAAYLMSIHGAMKVWESRTGTSVPAQAIGYPHWYSLAHDRAGVRFAALRHESKTVVLHTLPGGQILRELSFEIEGSAIAMSPDGEMIAIQDGGAVEIRTADGTLVERRGTPGRSAPADDAMENRREPALRHMPSHVGLFSEATLRFSRDGRRIASFVPDDGWEIWPPGKQGRERVAADQPLDDVADFGPPWPADWTIETGSMTLFTHRPSGTQIALPAPGPWVSNPANPRILACLEMHVELRGGTTL